MRILNSDNTTQDMNEVPNFTNDLNYCILDYSNQSHVDFFFYPLVYLDTFSSPAVDLQIGNFRIQMPLDWSILIGDKYHGDLEVIAMKYINDRDFSAFSMNPINGYMPKFHKIEMLDWYPDIKWYFPKLKHGHLLCVPLSDQKTTPGKGERGPDCIFFVRETTKLPECLDITKIF
jgi:hypothetical protein